MRLGRWSPDSTGPAWWRRLVQGSIKTQSGDTGDLLAEQRGQELEGGEAAVGDQHQLPLRHPATGLEDQLSAPVGELLVVPPAFAAVALRGGEGGEERQCPDPPGPGNRHQQHQAEPAQATRLDEMPVAGADWIPIDPLGADPLAAAALDRVVKTEEYRTCRHEAVQQQAKQHLRRRSPAPGSAVQHAMVVDEPPLPAEPGNPKNAAHRAPARRQNGSDQQHLGVPPAPLKKEWCEA